MMGTHKLVAFLLGLANRLLKVGDDVLDGLNSHGEPDHTSRDSGGGLLLWVELGVGGGRRVDSKGLAVSDVGDVGDEFEVVDEGLSRISATLHLEYDHGSSLPLNIFLLLLVLWVRLESRVTDVGDSIVCEEVLGDSKGVFAVPLHTEGERLDSEEEHPGVVGGDAGAEVTERDGAHTQDEGEGEEGRWEVDSPAKAAVRCVRVGVQGVVATCSPGEGSGVDHDSSEAVSVAS
mmetsp:Transcript_8366/g.16900  ORF Transcript_8366/g.16900 Transcript_8366/m.16900 type:complete len:233 (-) Transcript_8366:637-1335(-)